MGQSAATEIFAALTMIQTEMRLDPLRQTWTVFSRSRAAIPEFLRQKNSGGAGANPSPFAAGNEKYAAHTLHAAPPGTDWQVRVVPNRAPILRVEGEPAAMADGFYDRMDGVGAHEVIVETPGYEGLEALPLPRIEQVVNAWKVRMLDLARDKRMRAFFVIKNEGRPAGARVAHSVSELIAMAVVPPALKHKLHVARDFYERKKRAIFGDILRDEVRAGSRLVYENNGFAAFCPYASRTPFEMAIYPKRQCADFHGVTDQETAQLADALKSALQKLIAALDSPPYNLMLFTAPTRTGRRDYWNTIEQDFRWHIEIMPRLFPTGGFDIATGCSVNFVWPETAAEYLRKVEL
jgi:UDPglucose--hexose-1-phosphate uridylyltransferase